MAHMTKQKQFRKLFRFRKDIRGHRVSVVNNYAYTQEIILLWKK